MLMRLKWFGTLTGIGGAFLLAANVPASGFPDRSVEGFILNQGSCSPSGCGVEVFALFASKTTVGWHGLVSSE